MEMISSEVFMQRAIELARLGIGKVSPNPLVGCVIVHAEKIIGEGHHAQYGGQHAEVRAINSVVDREMLSQSILFVNLEPCAHFGKTPPCTDSIISASIKKVFIANPDINPLVAGKGIQKLKDAGIDVELGVCKKEGLDLNRRFFTYIEKKRPYVILKWAQTADGYIARESGESKWISNQYSRQLVHKWRSEEDAILVGTNTAQMDNPNLQVREWKGRNPLRIVIDRSGVLNKGLQLFDGSTATVCYSTKQIESKKNVEWVRLEDNEFLEQILKNLYERKVQSLIVEGGTQTINAFVESNLWDEARIFHSSKSFGSGLESPRLHGKLVSTEEVMGDRLEIFTNKL